MDQISIKLNVDICYLKTQNQRFKQFEMKLDGDTLNFNRQSKSHNKKVSNYTNSLKEVHITLDVQPAQCQKTGDLYYSIALLLLTDETRFLYFKSEQHRNYWYNRLLKAQGFTTEIE